MKKQFLKTLLLVVIGASGAAQADVLGWRVGANLWQQQFEGDVASGGASIDLEDDLNYDDESGASYYAQFEHPIPLLPNIMVQYTDLEADATGFVDGIEFDGVVYEGDVSSSMDLTHTDFTLYYEILDNWVNLDVGVTGRWFDDGIEILDQTSQQSGSIDIDHVVPMFYGHARFDLPFSGLSLGIEGNYISYNDDTLYDTKLNLGYTFAFGLGIEAGYRYMDFEYDDDDEVADVTIDGVYGGLYWDF
jgi:outer membrane protein